MATIIRVAGADFSANAIGFIPPVASGLVGWFQMGGTLSQSLRNLAPGGDDASAVGSPTVSASYISCDGLVDYLTTGIDETAGLTLIAVGRATGDVLTPETRPAFIGNYGAGGVNRGVMLYATASVGPDAAALNSAGAYLDAGVDAQYLAPLQTEVDLTAFRFMSASFEPGGNQRTATRTPGTGEVIERVLDRSTLTRMVRDAPIWIGGTPGNNSHGPCDVAFAAIYSRAITAAEENTLYTDIKARMAARGITI